MSGPKGGYYAVNRGREVGVFLTWEDCEAQVKGFLGARYKRFLNAQDAEDFAGGRLATEASPQPSLESISSASTSGVQASRSSAAWSTMALASSLSQVSVAPTVPDHGKKRAYGSIDENDGGNEDATDIVYTDGACKSNGQSGAVAGVACSWPNLGTNNLCIKQYRGAAILRVFETTRISKNPLLIRSDSQYSMQCVNDWLPTWERKNFKTASGTPVKNLGIIRCIAAHIALRKHRRQPVKFEYVKGHSGDVGNDGADAQANLGTRMALVPEPDWEELEAKVKRQMLEPERSMDVDEEVIQSGSKNRMPVTGESPPKARRTAAPPESMPPIPQPFASRSYHTQTARAPVESRTSPSRPKFQPKPLYPPIPFEPTTPPRSSPAKTQQYQSSHPHPPASPTPRYQSASPQKTFSVRPEDVDLSLYADCNLDDDEELALEIELALNGIY
ncbi:ribonuclease H-like domain-containing protein [Infundibulicybe gibba]|nr:ribonuclease H-like domain-containing protein [Infundibulicybe gibba]